VRPSTARGGEPGFRRDQTSRHSSSPESLTTMWNRRTPTVHPTRLPDASSLCTLVRKTLGIDDCQLPIARHGVHKRRAS
jgi:hypothetical protein